MATQEASPALLPSAEIIGNAFVEQYYQVLHESPEIVHMFYHDSSLLSRPNANGTMTTVTTMQAINNMILSLGYGDYTAEIETADSQDSHQDGVIVLVTGCLIGKDGAKRKFSQTFFLAPQKKGYFVLNDVFRFVGESTPACSSLDAHTVSENPPPPATVHQEMSPVIHPQPEPPTLATVGENIVQVDVNNGVEGAEASDKEGSVVEDVEPEPRTVSASESVAQSNADMADNLAKKSYASIVKVAKSSVVSSRVVVTAASTATPAPTSTEKVASSSKPSETEIAEHASSTTQQFSNGYERTEGYSIYVRNLPLDADVDQLHAAFKRFGTIMQDGIQVRSNKQGFCFGFVEFEALSSMHAALQASPISIGNRKAFVEEKRTTTRVNGRGGFPFMRGGFRGDGFRNRGGFSGGRGFGRGEFWRQGEFSPRPRPMAPRMNESYQPVTQNGFRRGGRFG